MLTSVFLIVWYSFQMVPGPCPEHRPGCAVMHYRKEYVEHSKFIFDAAVASDFCKDKQDCTVTPLSEEELTRRYGAPEENSRSFFSQK